MSTEFIPVPTPLPGAITLPDGNTRRATSAVNVPLETSLNAIAWLQQQLYAGAVMIPLVYPSLADNFVLTENDGFHEWLQDDVADVGQVTFMVPSQSHGGELLSLKIVMGHNGSHGALPAILPHVALKKRDHSPAAPGNSGSIVDTDITVVDEAELETYRVESFAIAAGNYFEAGCDYLLEVKGEADADAETGFYIAAAWITVGAP